MVTKVTSLFAQIIHDGVQCSSARLAKERHTIIRTQEEWNLRRINKFLYVKAFFLQFVNCSWTNNEVREDPTKLKFGSYIRDRKDNKTRTSRKNYCENGLDDTAVDNKNFGNEKNNKILFWLDIIENCFLRLTTTPRL